MGRCILFTPGQHFVVAASADEMQAAVDTGEVWLDARALDRGPDDSRIRVRACEVSAIMPLTDKED